MKSQVMKHVITRLSDSNIELLKTLPETGMGYQIVRTNQMNYMAKEVLVLNGRLAVGVDPQKYHHLIKAMMGRNFKQALTMARLVDFSILGIVPFTTHTGQYVAEERTNTGSSAKNNTIEKANGDELFVRLSAFEDDIRIDKKNNCLLPGSFATMASDALRCKEEKDDPVQRYALPSEFDIQWAYYIQPCPKDELQRGIVEPAFGKRGGGREAYFEKGTSSLTFITQSQW